MKCDTCNRRFRVREIRTEDGLFCSPECAEDGAEAADNHPCPKCYQYHDPAGKCRQVNRIQTGKAKQFELRNDPPKPPKIRTLSSTGGA